MDYPSSPSGVPARRRLVSEPHNCRPRFDLRPLAHPLWWLALAVLLVNDHFLKGRGLVPGWLTGKLSDFAFLVVGPVLLGCLLPLALRGRKIIALAAVTGLFAAADLSTAVSDGVVAVAARVGLHWLLWPDVTDLVAVVVLPLAWRLLDRPAERAAILRPIGVVVGLFACLATSNINVVQFPFLVNRSDGPVEVKVSWVRRQRICEVSLSQIAGALGPGDLGVPDDFSLQRGDVAALDTPPAPGASAARRCQNQTPSVECSVVLIEIQDGPAVLARAAQIWSNVPAPCQEPVAPNVVLAHDALSITGAKGSWTFVTTPEIETLEVRRADIDAHGADAGPPHDAGGSSDAASDL